MKWLTLLVILMLQIGLFTRLSSEPSVEEIRSPEQPNELIVDNDT